MTTEPEGKSVASAEMSGVAGGPGEHGILRRMGTRSGQRRPPSLWVLAGPTLTSIAMTLQLFSDRESKVVPALLLVGCLGLMLVLLVQHARARKDAASINRTDPTG